MMCYININQVIVLIDNNKKIRLFGQHLIDIALKVCCNIKQAKQYHLILEMAISSPECYFLLVAFSSLYSMIQTSPVKLYKMF